MSTFAAAASDSDSDSSHEPDWEMLASTLSPAALEALKLTMSAKAAAPAAAASSAPSALSQTEKADPSDPDYHPPLPSSNLAYGTHSYWEDRFANERTFDWLVTFKDVEAQLNAIVKRKCEGLEKETARVLLVGCGNSTFSQELYSSGYRNVTSIDYSEKVIEAMRVTSPDLKWEVMDMTKLSFEDGAFDIVIDKAAMDALMVDEGDVWNPASSVVSKSKDMCSCIGRVLVPGGLHLHISFAQPHFRNRYLSGEHAGCDFGWDLEHETIAGEGDDGCFHHFFYIMQKAKI